jgi:ribose/xylose/arabinose/galactoside ABC-type transport system permease subunit
MSATASTEEPVRAGSPAAAALGRIPRLEGQLLLVLVTIWVIFALISPDVFPTGGTTQNLTRQAGILLVVAIGQMFVLVGGGFDISVGANMGLAATVAALLTDDLGIVPAVLCALAVSAGAGLVNGVVVAKLGVNPFITTLAMLTFLGGLANQISSGSSVAIVNVDFEWLGARDWGPIPATAGIGAIVVVIAYVLLNRLRAGLYLYAMGGSRETTRLSGIPVARYEVLTYTICGLLAGVGGVMLASRTSVGQASLGTGYELLSIATAVIGGAAIGGGVGRLFGVVLGVAILTVLTSGLEIAGMSEFQRQMVTGAVLAAAVVFNQRRTGGFVRIPFLRSSRSGSGLSGPPSTPKADS